MNKNEFGTIGVLMGGPSSEREISLKSGNAVYAALTSAGFPAVAIDIITDDKEAVSRQVKESGIDVAFIALHGYFGEDGAIQQILERLDIPHTGSGVDASKRAIDKAASRAIFQAGGLLVAKGLIVERGEEFRVDGMRLPLVVKPVSNGSSIGLSLAERAEDVAAAVAEALRFDQRALIEEYISGKELTVGILHDAALPPIEVRPHNKFFDFESKYKKGMTDYIIPAEIGPQEKRAAMQAGLRAHQLLGCSGCSRVDMILADGGDLYILELNSIPGLTETSLLPKAARYIGVDFLQLCITLIQSAYEKEKCKTLN